ncbi:MAG: flippase [Candidatus Sulfotelmatobacter sp.]
MTEMSVGPQTTAPGARSKFSPLVRNVFSNWLGFAVASIVSFFLSPFVVRHLGNSGYGVWTLTMSLTGYLGLLDLGVRGAVTRYVAKYHVQQAHANTSKVVSTALAIFLAGGAIAIILSIGIGLPALRYVKMPADFQFAARVVIFLTAINIAISMATGVFGGVVVALQRQDLTNGIEISNTLLRAIAIVAVLHHGWGLISLAVVQLSFAICAGTAYVVTAIRLYPEFRIDFSECDKEHFKLICSFSMYLVCLRLASILIFYTDSVVISVFLPVSAVTFFVIAGNLTNYSRGMLSGISTAVTPAASALEARGQVEELNRVLLKGTRYATMIFLPIGITFLIRGSSFIGLWMGRSYASLSGEVLSVLTVALLFSAGNGVAGSMVLGIGRHKGIVPVALAEGLSNLGLSILLIRHYGIVGVAVGTAVPNLLVNLIFWPLYIRHVYGIGIPKYVFSTWIRPGLAALPFALCTYSVQKWWPVSHVGFFFVQTACCLPAVVIAFWLFCLTAGERRDYLRKLRFPAVGKPAPA